MTPPPKVKAHTNGAARRRVDLDAIRRARAEKAEPPPVIVFGGKEWTLVPGPPASVLIGVGRLQEGELSGLHDVIGGLFGPDHVDEVLAAGFEVDDLEPVLEAYGLNVGEAPASDVSS
jgi:hypothetical protein